MTSTLPAAMYTDPSVYERERHSIFGRQWQLAGFRAQLREPGEYVRYDFAGWTIVVVVQDDGALRAFHNVCRHRAGPLVTDDRGSGGSLVCRYHGWAYALDGRLRSARDFGDDVLDRDAFGLIEVRVDEWRGLVFVNLDDEVPALSEDHGAFFEAVAHQPLETFSYSHRLVHRVAANWKVYCDNYGEGYHVPLVHPELNREIVAKEYRVEVGDHFCEHSAPARDGAINTGTWVWRYPNLALNVYPGGMNVERFVPDGPSDTYVVYDYFFADLDAINENAEVVRLGCDILDEDRAICEAVQRNLETGIYDTGVLSPRHENGVAAFQQWVRESLGA
ncbi:MAG: choline monooxygenase [Actinomycetota bacterium]|nr:choline monooxygenase [Actinomycetota bacterium]